MLSNLKPDSDRQPETTLAFVGYGLSLHANQPIPGLSSAAKSSPADVRIWLGQLPPGQDRLLGTEESWYASPELEESGQPGLVIWKLADGSHFRWVYVDGHEFVITQDGTEVWAKWPDSGTLNDAAAYLLGPILGFVLRLRGVLCIHASAVSFEDRVIAFVGPKGAGKSTTAAAFAARGYPIVTDDIVALAPAGKTFLTQPGYPRLRLWPSSLGALSRTNSLMAQFLPSDWGNTRYHLDLTRDGCRFEERVLPLAAIYFLAERADTSGPYFEQMSGSEGLMALVANTYASKLLDNTTRAQEFKILDRLVGQAHLRRFYPHLALDNLTSLCDVILGDFKRLEADASRLAVA